jgi:G3E family GTPase
MSNNDPRIPVTLLTGFLGAGKTTLLNRILAEEHGRKIAVIENEFGEIGIDHDLIEYTEENLIEMNNGCLCCTVRGDLIAGLQKILLRVSEQGENLDRVIIESTGMAHPGPVCQTFFLDPEIEENFRLDAVVTLVDLAHLEFHLEPGAEAWEQIAFADLLICNKRDLVTEEVAQKWMLRLKELNPAAPQIVAQMAAVDLHQILDLNAFAVESKLEIRPDFLEEEQPFEWAALVHFPADCVELELAVGPDPSMLCCVLPVCVEDLGDLNDSEKKDLVWKKYVQKARAIFPKNPHVISPGEVLFAEESTLLNLDLEGEWPPQNLEQKYSYKIRVPQVGTYVFFGEHHAEEFDLKMLAGSQDLTPLQTKSFRPNHSHQEEVASIGLEAGLMDPLRLRDWLNLIAQGLNIDLFRYKGIIALPQCEEQIVLQGVHMIHGLAKGRKWREGEERRTKIVLIGKNLPRAGIVRDFLACEMGMEGAK